MKNPIKHQPPKVDILFEDDHIVVLNKPSGLLSLPDRFETNLPNLRTMLKEQYGEIFVVHRLDEETSGIMIFAKHADAHKALSEQFEKRSVRKIYHGIMQGGIEPELLTNDAMNVDIPLMPDPVRKGLMAPSVRGKEALTIVRVLKRFRLATLVECELVTGRQHQIRVHCAAIGHPLLVDPDYGTATEFRVSTIKRKFNLGKWEEEKPLIARTTLHSYSVTFTHPSTGETMTLEAPYPKDFKAVIQVLDKYAPFRTSSFATSYGSTSWQEIDEE